MEGDAVAPAGQPRAGDAREQRVAAQAIKRARYMGLLPYTSATL